MNSKEPCTLESGEIRSELQLLLAVGHMPGLVLGPLNKPRKSGHLVVIAMNNFGEMHAFSARESQCLAMIS